MQKKVSVIVNNYNGEGHINNAIKSIDNQTYQNIEIILYDNNSSDNSLKIIKNIKLKKKIKFLRSKKKIKLYEARNNAIKYAKGYYIAFLDVDDTWEKNKIREQVKKITRDNNDIIYSNHWIQEPNNTYLLSKKKLPSGKITKEIIENYPITISTVLLKKQIFNDYGKFNKKFEIIGDFDFFFKVSIYKKISVIQEPLATYKIHKQNTSIIKIKDRISEMEKWLKINHLILKKLNLLKYTSNIKQKNLYLKLSDYIIKNNFSKILSQINKLDNNLLKCKILIKYFIFYLKKIIN